MNLKLAAISLWTSLLALPGEMRIYLVGNSLTDTVQYDGLTELAQSRNRQHVWGRSTAPGAAIFWHWTHEPSFTQPPFGAWNKALVEYPWDALSLQPFSTYGQELEAARQFINLATTRNPNIQVYGYAQWMKSMSGDFASVWLRLPPSGEEPKVGTQVYYERFVEDLRRDFPNLKAPRIIPGGHALYLLDQKIKAGLLPGYSSIFELFTDNIHLDNVGAYLIACTFFATLYQESPVGLPVVRQYQQVRGNMRSKPLEEWLARILQETAWEVVSTHPLSGVRSNEEVKVASVHLPPAVVGDFYRSTLLAAFGEAPYHWSLADSALPEGLSLTPDGTISGLPSRVGAVRTRFELSDACGGKAHRELILEVSEDTEPKIVTKVLPTLRVAEYQQVKLEAIGGNGPLNWAFKNRKPPAGLELGLDGTLSGSPVDEGDAIVEVRVVDSDLISPDFGLARIPVHIEAPSSEALEIREIEANFSVDGNLNEPFWKLDQVVEKLVSGPATKNVVTFGVACFNRELLIGIHVQDEQLLAQESDPARNDSVEIFIDGLNNRESMYNSDDRHIVVDIRNRVTIVGNADGIRSKTLLTQDGYNVEVAIDFYRSLGFKPKNRVIGLDVANRDIRWGRAPSLLVWRGNVDNKTDPSHFAPVILRPLVLSNPK